MSASLFSTLPTELICQIFESADDFSMVAALAQTARVFYQTWRENPTSICKAVAPRSIPNLSDAERLLDIQEKAKIVSQTQESWEQKPIIRARRLLFNARCASAASDCWMNFCQIQECAGRGEHLGEDPHMRPSELARFRHAFYCVWTLGIMDRTPHLHDQASVFLDECGPRELCGLGELAEWAMYYNENDFGSLGLDLRAEVWKAACGLVSDRWSAYQDGGKQGSRARCAPSAKDTPVGWFAFFDHTQRYLDLIEEEYREDP